MKILHISRSMGHGGAQKIIYQLCMDNKNYEQMIISAGGYYVPELESAGVKHFIIPDMDKKNPLIMIKCFWKILRVIKSEKVDVVHTHHRMAAFYAQLVSMFCNVKKVYTSHSVFRGKKILMNFALKNTKIVAVGDGVKRNLVSEYDIPAEEIVVIKNTIKIQKNNSKEKRLEELKKENKVLIGVIGRLSEQKGVDIFLKSMCGVVNKYPNAIGVIVGDGEKRQELEQLVEQLELTRNIIFLGFKTNVLDIISQLDFVVSSSQREGLPLTPIEVFSQGKTIVASDICGINEVVTNRKNGLLCKMNDSDAFANKIMYMIEESEKRRIFEENAFNTYLKEYSYEVFLEEYLKVYCS